MSKDFRFKKVFIKSPCQICGKMISNCGFAYTKHDEMHKRKGETKENFKEGDKP